MTSSPPRVHGIDASYYLTKKLTDSTKFYSELLGMEPTMHMPDFVTEFTFPGGETFGLYQSEQMTPSGGVMFAVDDVADFVAKAKAGGVEFDEGGEITDTPVCHMAFGKDPEGNGFIVHHRK
jgi:predicted enzyme related to lactoylglutathione lyase